MKGWNLKITWKNWKGKPSSSKPQFLGSKSQQKPEAKKGKKEQNEFNKPN